MVMMMLMGFVNMFLMVMAAAAMFSMVMMMLMGFVNMFLMVVAAMFSMVMNMRLIYLMIVIPMFPAFFYDFFILNC